MKILEALPQKQKKRGYATRNAGSWVSDYKAPTLLFKAHQGGSAGDKYAHDKADETFTNMLSQTPKERVDEWRLDKLRYPNVKNLFIHLSLSLAEHRTLEAAGWRQVAESFLKKIGAEGCNFAGAIHRGENEHLHIVFSRARPDGTLVDDSWNFYRWRKYCHEVADDMLGGSVTPRKRNRPNLGATLSDRHENALRRARRRKTQPNHVDLDILRRALSISQSLEDFLIQLKTYDHEANIISHEKRNSYGITFRRRGSVEWIAGSSINHGLSLTNIIKTIEAQKATLTKYTPKEAEEQKIGLLTQYQKVVFLSKNT